MKQDSTDIHKQGHLHTAIDLGSRDSIFFKIEIENDCCPHDFFPFFFTEIFSKNRNFANEGWRKWFKARLSKCSNRYEFEWLSAQNSLIMSWDTKPRPGIQTLLCLFNSFVLNRAVLIKVTIRLFVNSLTNDKILSLSKLKESADDKSNVTQNIKFVFHCVENIVR